MTDEVPEATVENEFENQVETGSETESEKNVDPILEGPLLSRREFLYDLWGASMVVIWGASGGLALWFALPRFKEGEFFGVFVLPVSETPAPDPGLQEFAEGRFWLVNLGQGAVTDPRQPSAYPVEPGLRAIQKVCTHLGCLDNWVEVNQRFECPCHGSKFLQTDPEPAIQEGPLNLTISLVLIGALGVVRVAGLMVNYRHA